MMNNEDISIDKFVQMSPLAAPQGFFAHQRRLQNVSNPQYGAHNWTDSQNCYIYALDWPGAGAYSIFDVGDIHAFQNKNETQEDIEFFTDNSYLDYKMEKMGGTEKITAEQYRDLIRKTAERDGLLPINADEGTDPSQIPDLEGHYLAVLYIDPDGLEHHWYRLDRNGYWSQKPGQFLPTNLDASGNRIVDPRTAARGPWKMFGGFFHVPARDWNALFKG